MNIRLLIVIEAVLMYIDQEKIDDIFRMIAKVAAEYAGSNEDYKRRGTIEVSVAFADRFPAVNDAARCSSFSSTSSSGTSLSFASPSSTSLPLTSTIARTRSDIEEEACDQWLSSLQFQLCEYQGKPGRARSMGLARLK